ncbi:MAG: MaoC family dehydratase [Chloroflexi bacterium]|nr:MAG: MaoC family dehydratase [Chloroflexota bacterium]
MDAQDRQRRPRADPGSGAKPEHDADCDHRRLDEHRDRQAESGDGFHAAEVEGQGRHGAGDEAAGVVAVVTDSRWVGRSYETAPFEVTEQSIRDYMAAVGDLREDGDLVAPPTYAMVYGFDAYWQLWTDQEVALDVAHLVHGEQRFSFQRPVRAGDRIRTTGRLTAINTRGDMELVSFELKAIDERDQPVSDGTALFIIRKP